jgi:hypothetical protein
MTDIDPNTPITTESTKTTSHIWLKHQMIGCGYSGTNRGPVTLADLAEWVKQQPAWARAVMPATRAEDMWPEIHVALDHVGAPSTDRGAVVRVQGLANERDTERARADKAERERDNHELARKQLAADLRNLADGKPTLTVLAGAVETKLDTLRARVQELEAELDEQEARTQTAHERAEKYDLEVDTLRAEVERMRPVVDWGCDVADDYTRPEILNQPALLGLWDAVRTYRTAAPKPEQPDRASFAAGYRCGLADAEADREMGEDDPWGPGAHCSACEHWRVWMDDFGHCGLLSQDDIRRSWHDCGLFKRGRPRAANPTPRDNPGAVTEQGEGTAQKPEQPEAGGDEQCETCDGYGFVGMPPELDHDCEDCNGTGKRTPDEPKLDDMTDAECDAELRAIGVNPEEVKVRGRVFVETLKENARLRAAVADPRPADERLREAVDEVLSELGRAESKFKPFNSAHEGYAVLAEEVDELWEAVRMKDGTDRDREMHSEVIQVAAMAFRFLRDVCRKDRAALANTGGKDGAQ